MTSDFDTAVGRRAAAMPACWKTDYKLAVARASVTADAIRAVNLGARQFALDALPRSSLDRDINRFMRGDQMPMMTTSPAAAVPAGSHGDNRYHTGGNRFRMRGGDQSNGVSVQQLLNFIVSALQEMTDDEAAAFFEGLGGLLDSSAAEPAEDQGSSLRLPNNGGTGSDPSDFFNQSTAGSFSERDEAWRGIGTPPGASDQRPRQRRMLAQDRRQELDASIRQRAANTQDFLARFPQAGKIEIWG